MSDLASTVARVMINMLIVRHGESEWNATGRWQGQADPPLSDIGIAQAQTAARAVGTVDAIFASDLDRALTTAQIIGEAIGVGPVMTESRFRERDVGPWQGLTREEIDRDYPGYLEQYRFPDGWEKDDAVSARVHHGLDDLVSTFGAGTVLIVSHAGVIYSLEMELGCGWERIPNLNGRWFTMESGEVTLGERVALISDESVATAPEAR